MKNLKVILKIIYIFLTLTIVINTNLYAKEEQTNNTINEQQESFGINDFIKESKEYTGEFFQGMDIQEILNDAIKGEVDNSTIYKKVLNLFGKEVKSTITTLISILAIILIHSILKAISEGLKNDNISKIIYYVQYILIVTIIMANVSDIVKLVQDTCVNLVGFMNMLVPLLTTLMLYTGSIVTSNITEPIILFMINLLGNTIQNIIIPIILILTSLTVITKISNQVQIDKITNFFKSSVVWFLGIILTIFVGVISLEGTLASSIDGITAKGAKAVVSSAIPVVGKILGDAVDTVLRMWSSIKKCSRYCRCTYNSWYMYTANYKINSNNVLI